VNAAVSARVQVQHAPVQQVGLRVEQQFHRPCHLVGGGQPAEGVLRQVLLPDLFLGDAPFGGYRGRDPAQPGRIRRAGADRVRRHPTRPVDQADLAHQVEDGGVDGPRPSLMRAWLKAK
jgi:hypothetical protein